MTQKQKTNQVMAGIGLLMLAILAFLLTFNLALTPPGGGEATAPILGSFHLRSIAPESPLANALLWLLLPALVLLIFYGGIWRLKSALAIRDSALAHKPRTLWSQIGSILQYTDILNTGFFLLIFLVLLFLIGLLFWSAPKAITVNVFLYLAAMVICIVLRKKISALGEACRRRMRKGLPTYTLTEKGVLIKLVRMANKKYPDPPPVFLTFAEIEDLQVITYVEAQSYLRYNIGPDLNIGLQQAKDYAKYVKGEIARPSIYAFGAPSSDLNVVIRGPQLFYMLTFDTDDVSDLLEAYRSYRKPDAEVPQGGSQV